MLAPRKAARLCCMQGAAALMHASGVVHADLKPENVLLRAQPRPGQSLGSCPEVALCDLGSAFSCTETDMAKLAFEMQTLPYRAPEVRMQLMSEAALIELWVGWRPCALGVLQRAVHQAVLHGKRGYIIATYSAGPVSRARPALPAAVWVLRWRYHTMH